MRKHKRTIDEYNINSEAVGVTAELTVNIVLVTSIVAVERESLTVAKNWVVSTYRWTKPIIEGVLC